MWTKAQILELLDKNDRAVSRAITALFKRQTSDEQAQRTTRKANNVGFNSGDAPLLSYYADYIQARGQLTGRHLDQARRRVRKYAGQLVDIANANTRQPSMAQQQYVQGGEW